MIQHSLFNFLNLYKIQYTLQQTFSLFHYCKLCGIPNYNLICNICFSELELIDINSCKQCKQTINLSHNSIDKKCLKCINNFTNFDNLYCKFKYSDPLNRILHQFKYSKKIQYHKLLAKLFYISTTNAPNPDLIIPMPLHKSKLKSRGFNQAEKLLFFHRVFAHKNIINSRITTRIKATESQSLLNRNHRQNNITNAFKIHKI